jgi:3-oxoacyl-(acyl-carrier-protein) synthase
MISKVVITGLGVVAPQARNAPEFLSLLRRGRSAITFCADAAELGLCCQVVGAPAIDEDRLQAVTIPAERRAMNRIMDMAALAAVECWQDAGLPYFVGADGEADPRTGVVFGSGIGGIETLCETVAPMVSARRARQLGAKRVEQTMASGAAACVSGLLGAGGPVIASSAACTTGSTCIVQALRLLRAGLCDRVVTGAAETSSSHTRAMFDAMRVLVRDGNDRPETASRPLSARAAGFVPAGGAGALLLETLDSAVARGARIYAELAGGFDNCGGQRSGGTMSRQSPEGVVRCVRGALADAGVDPEEIDYVNGHLTGTTGDAPEVSNIAEALGRSGGAFPWLNATKSLIGHTIGAAGAVESVATVLQLHHGFLHPSVNCDEAHPDLPGMDGRIVRSCIASRPRAALKTSFGFGDVNACLVFRPWTNQSASA